MHTHTHSLSLTTLMNCFFFTNCIAKSSSGVIAAARLFSVCLSKLRFLMVCKSCCVSGEVGGERFKATMMSTRRRRGTKGGESGEERRGEKQAWRAQSREEKEM